MLGSVTSGTDAIDEERRPMASEGSAMFVKVLARFERVITLVLMVLMMLVVTLATVDLIWTIVRGAIRPPFALFTIEKLLEIFGAFLLVLIGLELLETIKAYLNEHAVHAEIVLMAAIVAAARKVIIVDPKELTPLTILAIAGLVLALTLGYYLFRRAQRGA
jgi:uncharacterized membrane protein (DUF373 family)